MEPIKQPSLSIRSVLERQLVERPGATFLIAPETGRKLTFARLFLFARSLAGLLSRHGIAPGESVALLLPNGFQAVRLFVGTMAAGYVVTPLSLLAQPAQLAFVLEHSDCRLVFVGPEQEAVLRLALAQVARSIEVLSVDPDGGEVPNELLQGGKPDERPKGKQGVWPTPAPEGDQDALLMYTSGTTGRPKGVSLTHANLLAGARFVAQAHGLGVHDRVLGVLPLYHINAQVVTVLAPLYSGGSLVMPRRFSASAFWPLTETRGCTWLNLVPTIVSYLLVASPEHGHPNPNDRTRVRFCRSASAPLAPELQRAFESRFGIGIVETMGLTETAGPCFSNPLEPRERRIGSVGRPFGNEARIAAPATGEELAEGAIGEIQVRGPNVARGYRRDPEETARALMPDGWLRTGDLGYRDRDGFYFVTGRIKELIIKGGENISPREIDEALLRHPAVLEAAAVGVPDPHYGQDIEAGVVLRPGASCSEDSLRAFCTSELGPFKTPRAIRLLGELPKGPSGKVQRLRLLDQAS